VRPAVLGQRPLNGHCALHRVAGALKRHEEPVADGLHDFPAVGGKLGAQLLIVPADEVSPGLISQGLDQVRGPDDVGEHERPVDASGCRPVRGLLTQGLGGQSGVRARAQPVADLPDLRHRPAEVQGEPGRQLLAGQQGLRLGLAPHPAKLVDLGPVEPADAGEAVDRPPPAPPFGSVRPFAGAAVVRQSPARTHRAAVDPARHLRAQLARDGSGGSLVEQRHALLDPTLGHQRPALQMQSHRLKVRDTEGRTDVEGPPTSRSRGIEVPAGEGGHPTHDRDEGVHGLLGRSLQETRGPVHPPVEHRRQAGPEEVERKPRTPRSRRVGRAPHGPADLGFRQRPSSRCPLPPMPRSL
jgi:hypothetical protein